MHHSVDLTESSDVTSHEVIGLDATNGPACLLLRALSDSLLFLSSLVLQVGLHLRHVELRRLLLLVAHLWVQAVASLAIGVVRTLLNDVRSLGVGLHLAEDRSSLLHLAVDQLDLFFDLFEHFLKTTLLENRLGALQVLFCLLRLGRVIDHVEGTDDLVSLGDVHTALAVQCRLQLLQQATEKWIKSHCLDRDVKQLTSTSFISWRASGIIPSLSLIREMFLLTRVVRLSTRP